MLSLDAPLVAVVWQRFLAGVIRPVEASVTIVLALSVWLVYVADRLLDTLGEVPNSPRHRFVRRHAALLVILWVLGLLVDVAVAWRWLDRVEFRSGLLLVVAAAVRLAAGMRLPDRHWLKDLLTALVFAGGVWMPFPRSVVLHPDAALFALLCWWNCRAIHCWEARCRTRGLRSAGMALVLGSFGYYLLSGSPVGLAAGITAVGFLILGESGDVSLNWRRVAVDLCLLSPIVVHVR